MALIVAALVGVALLIVPASPIHRSPTLGLDLQGGLEVTLKAVPPEGRQLQKSDIDRSLEIIRNRVDKLGTSEPVITKQGDDQISIELPGVTNVDTAREIIGKTAKLELYDLQTAAIGPSITPTTFQVNATDSIFRLLSSAGAKSLIVKNGEGGAVLSLRPQDEGTRRRPAAHAGRAAEEDRRQGAQGQVVLAVPKKTVIVTCGAGAGSAFCPGVGTPAPGQTAYYLFRYEPDAEKAFPQMGGEDLKSSGTRQTSTRRPASRSC